MCEKISQILDIIRMRHSSRVPFDPNRPIPKDALNKILGAARWTPTAHNMQNYQIIAIDDPVVLQKMSAIKSKLSEEFLKENLTQLSFSEDELAKRKVGISASGFPPDWVKPDKISQLAQTPIAPIGNSLRGSPMLLMVLYDASKRAPASSGDVYGFISLGCLMENIWLTAEALGLGMQILSLSATASIEPELKQLLGVPPELKIAYSIRLGYPAAPVKALRVRRDIANFVHYNGYGNKNP